MKKLFIILTLFISYCCNAQNYQCLQSGPGHYFINGNGYLRGARIDSVITMGDSTVYYPNHTPRGAYSTTGGAILLNSNGGSWLGKKVLQKSDGTFIFDSYWNDSVIIKTKANIGDSWVFYKDTSALYYRATLISKDSLTVLSTPDSIQTIMINAYNGAGIVTTDPLDSFEIILSKNHGFIQVIDLYTFPYHKPDSVYRPGLDFYLDKSTCNYSNVNSLVGSGPSRDITIFKRTDFINPNDQQLHNWSINDIIGSYHSFTTYPYTGSFSYTNYMTDTISNKVVSGHAINYTLSGTYYTCTNSSDPCNLIIRTGTCSFYDTAFSIADTAFIPEENFYSPDYIFYFPDDTSQCVLGPGYIITPAHNSAGGAGPVSHTNYKLGIGELYNQYSSSNHLLLEWNGLTYTNIHGTSCGSVTSTSVNNTKLIKDPIILFPNPATSEIMVTTTYTIDQISITNILGQTVFAHNYSSEKVRIDIAAMPVGIYFMKINGLEVRKFVKD